MQQMQQQLQQMNQAGEELAQELEQAKKGDEVKMAELKASEAESMRRLEETRIKHDTTIQKAAADVRVAELNAGVKTADLLTSRLDQ